jgi:sugar O-acyltransferase (sialic acid O-acetyltransferase NeuD family)
VDVLKSRLIIVGAGDFAREVLMFARDVPASERDWEPAGFLDDSPDAAAEHLRAKGVDLPVLGAIGDHQPRDDERFVCAIGSTRAKLAVCEALRERGGRFANLIHPTVQVGPGSTLGEGVMMLRLAGVTVNVTVGDFVTINTVAGAGHDVVIEDGCTLSSHSEVAGNGYLERGVFLGSHASVLPGARVGAFATVGAGSVVLRRVAPGATVFGVPAKPLGF